MMDPGGRSLRQQVRDALWYLRRPAGTPEDRRKAVEILEDVAGERGFVDRVELAAAVAPAGGKAGAAALAVRLEPVRGQVFALAAGHEPGGGAKGERAWNIRCAKRLARMLVDAGARVYYYEHRRKAYARRQAEFAAAVEREAPVCLAVLELHYDAVETQSVGGHHFQYRGAPELAGAIRDEWQRRFPNSRPRYDDGVRRNLDGNGAGFLKMAPAWACLTEPFFRSNPEEWDFYKGKITEVAEVYACGLADFAKQKVG
jgi:hypothetical protein